MVAPRNRERYDPFFCLDLVVWKDGRADDIDMDAVILRVIGIGTLFAVGVVATSCLTFLMVGLPVILILTV